MNIDEIFAEIDRLYTENKSDRLEEFILDKLSEAAKLGDENVMIQLLNELIGHYRETGDFERMNVFAEKLLAILEGSSLKGSMAHATSLLNVANAYRAGGRLRESALLFSEVKSYYDENVPADSMLYASLLNNYSLLFQEMTDYESAADCLERALGISLMHKECRIEQATTYSNLAATLAKLGRTDEAKDHLKKAFELFEEDEVPDYHYSAALSAMAEICYMEGDYASSVTYYKKAAEEIEKCVGKSHAYEITKQNMEKAIEKAMEGAVSRSGHMSGLELSRKYYEEYGKKMIHEKFPAYEDRIAVGLVGRGSECLGFDDSLSTDHDFGPGFCMWLVKDDYRKIGKDLQKEYDKLPDEFLGYRKLRSQMAEKRDGVFTIGKFYKGLIGKKNAPKKDEEWLAITDAQFFEATDGEVFTDGLGGFSWIRKQILEYYPDSVWKRKIAQYAALMSQTGQYNYPRMIKRGDVLTASVYRSDFIRYTMQMLYLLERKFAPYIKWMRKGLEGYGQAGETVSKLDALAALDVKDEAAPGIIEDICSEVLARLCRMGLASGDDSYLDHHTSEIIYGIPKKDDRLKKVSKEKLIEKIVLLEWNAFDKVENQGGRASCQDDYDTFSIMRKSQYMLWNREMLESFIEDFEDANARGWNLITEKYGRMEESTAPEEYAKIKESLPVIPDEKKKIIEAIVAIQVGMMEEFAKEYPKAAGEARTIHTKEDDPFNTSYETYLRGEISTYSDRTLELYGRFVAKLANEGRNIAKETIENSALMYGYASLSDMESKL